ncbi:MAG: CPA1 family monovalent cation:H+ antiporter [Bacteroidia bacterium]|jgi:CPA1 family monovalent cation:H+ antiporter
MLESFAYIFGLVALLNIINYKWLKLPSTIGLMIMSIGVVGLLYVLKPLFPGLFENFCTIVYATDFQHLLFDGLLGFLLFAGAMHINIKDLAKERWSVFMFAILGTLISTVIVGVGIYFGAQLFGVELHFVQSLLFGALISPTDPIAVLSILKEANISKSLQLKIEGESLFNDGIGVVVFSGILLFLPSMMGTEGESVSSEIGLLFLHEAIGGLLFGAVLGTVAYFLMKFVFDNAQLTVIISIACVFTGTALAQAIGVSAPLAMVVCGLIVGNAIDINCVEGSKTKESLNEIWEVLEQAFNGVLFVLIGLSIHLLNFDVMYLVVGLLAILIVLAARFISVYASYSLLKHKEQKPLDTVKILTWGGLRGGISIALALSLGIYAQSEAIIFITYIVVLFSIIVQGLSIKRVVKKVLHGKD